MKIGIITINDNNNYGNRLQNYAVQQIMCRLGNETCTIRNNPRLNKKNNIIKRIYKKMTYLKCIYIESRKNNKRKEKFEQFNNNIRFSKEIITPYNKTIKMQYDYFIAGSDQIWKPTFGRLSEVDLLDFADDEQKIALSASFGISELPQKYEEKTKKALSTFKAISVREEAGKRIVQRLTKRSDIEVLLDPTMMLNDDEWDKVSKKPEQLEDIKNKKYILNYFLGELPEQWKKEINKVANENNCEVINILDPKSPFYQTGPSEFLYLEKNAFMICTDSFHSAVFSIIYNTPFVIFDRVGSKISMNSRIDTLLSKFKLENRRFNGNISKELLKCDYTEAEKILNEEKEKTTFFLKKALNIKNEYEKNKRII